MYTSNEVETRLTAWKQRGDSKTQMIRELAESCLDWPYVYAANGEMCTPEWRKNRMGVSDEKYSKAIHDACPVLNGSKKQEIGFAAVVDDAGVAAYQAPAVKSSSCAGCKWEGCRCFDCQGFVHWLLSKVGVPFYGAGATTQWTTASNWAVSGEIKNMPSDMVCCLYKYKDGKMSHAGMSMGDGHGDVIHCSTIVKRGNIKTDTPAWTHWGIPRGLYSLAELESAGFHVDASQNIATLRRGNTGETVVELQKILNEKYHANLTVDGNFGKKTEEAVKAFQSSNRLTADGVVGPKTWIA